MKNLLLLGFITPFAFSAGANEVKPYDSLDYAKVMYVKADKSSDNSWCFNTTVRHNDEGWEHYADAWQVRDLKGNILAERVLAHPHNNEQPFTRSLCNIVIPETLSKVVVSAKCNEHGFGGRAVVVDFNIKQGKDYSVVF